MSSHNDDDKALQEKVMECEKKLKSIKEEIEQYLKKQSGEGKSDTVQGGVLGDDNGNSAYNVYAPDEILDQIPFKRGDSDDDDDDDDDDNELVTARNVAYILDYAQEYYTRYEYDDSFNKQILMDRMMPYLFLLYRMNTEKLANFMMKDPTHSSVYTDRKVYAALVEHGLFPLEVELEDKTDAPVNWFESSMFDFASILRQQICLYRRAENGVIKYFYNKDTVNDEIVAVPESEENQKIADTYKKGAAKSETEQKRLQELGYTLNQQQSSLEGKEQQTIDARKRNMRSYFKKRANKMAEALKALNGDRSFIPDMNVVREDLKRMYRCNGVDIDTGQVTLDLKNDDYEDSDCKPLLNKTEAELKGLKKGSMEYYPLKYTFHVVSTIRGKEDEENPWNVIDVIQMNNLSQQDSGRSQDNDAMNSKPFVDLIRHIKNDVNKYRVEAYKQKNPVL